MSEIDPLFIWRVNPPVSLSTVPDTTIGFVLAEPDSSFITNCSPLLIPLGRVIVHVPE